MLPHFGWTGPVADHMWFDFPKVGVPALSSARTPYFRWAWAGMPKIPPDVIDSVFYLYKSREDAEEGKPFGGTGFIVAVQSGLHDFVFPYAVSNWHVVARGGASVVRVNKKGGGVDIFDYGPEDWSFIPGGYDIAIAPLPVRSEVHGVTVLTDSILITRQELAKLEIGPGEDVFMIGRFVDHDGAGTNVPAARFGHISVMPQSVKQPTGSTLPSFILDIHSRTGYSGSPVFVYRTATSDISKPYQDLALSGASFLKLLAIHWDQFPEMWEIGRGSKKPEVVELSDDARFVKGMSGMTLAAPAWAIQELLELPRHIAHRAVETARESARRKRENDFPLTGETEDEAAPEAENPAHKADFTSLLGRAAKASKRGG